MTIDNVLGLFDGYSSGQIALGRAGIRYEKYLASEIAKDAIKTAMANYPDTIQLGDVTKASGSDLPKIDLLIGGSPCQGFSFSGKGLNFDDPRSKLFFEFARLKEECAPKYFMLENVVMKKQYQDVISEHLGVEPIEINSSLTSAQHRRRLYWTNIKGVSQPEDKKIKLADILETQDYPNKATVLGRRINEKGHRDDYNKNIPVVQCLEVRASNRDKCNCLTTVAKDNVLTTLPIGRHIDVFGRKLPFRYYTVKEYCRLQNLPENYFDCISSENKIREMIGNGWTIGVIEHLFRCLKDNN